MVQNRKPTATVDNSVEPPVIDFPRRYNAAEEFVDVHVPAGRGDKVAFIDHRSTCTYAELASQVNRAGNALKSLGVEPEHRVLLCVLDSEEFPALFWGGIKAGAVMIPLNTMMTTEDYAYILEDSRARVLVVSDELYEKFAPLIDSAASLRHVIVTDADRAGCLNLAGLLAAASDTLPVANTTADDVAFWLYTSGSTGRPKGAMHLHRDLLYTAVHYGTGILGMREDDLVFSAAKLFFAYGLGNTLTFPLYAGATAVMLAQRPTPQAVAHVLRTHQPTIFFAVPTLYAAILAEDPATLDFVPERLRLCVSAGEALPEHVAQRWEERFGCEIIDGLGSTEMLHIFLSNRPGNAHYGTTGVAVPGYELRLVDENDKAVAAGDIGELLVRGGSAAMAYWNQRARSQATFQGSWTRTGDQYIQDEDGFYTYCGRNDDMLKVGGIWVSPFEVESALIEHDLVLEAGVVGQADGDGLIKPKACVVLHDPTQANDRTVAELQGFVKTRLAPYKYPRWIEFVASLPKTATGKVQRYKLRAPTQGSSV